MIAIAFLFVLSLAASPLFPPDYKNSRRVFRAQCATALAAGAGFHRRYDIPSAATEDLSVDVTYYARGGRRLLVMVSGTHGVEAPAGAAVQELARREHLAALLAGGTDVLFVHALDPFGFAHARRVDEQNINLNRNFLPPGAGYDLANPGYERLRRVFEPKGPVGAVPRSYLATDARLLGALGRGVLSNLPALDVARAVRPISEGMNQGQYAHPRGVNFGGFGPAPQVALVRDLLTPLIAAHDQTIFIDWHTGLGEAGALHLMLAEGSDQGAVRRLKETFAGLQARDIHTTVVAEDPGFFRTTGDIIDFVAGLATPGHAVVALTAEFGTMGESVPAQLRSAHRLIAENQAWFNGCTRVLDHAVVRRDFACMFNPPDDAWRANALAQAAALLEALR